MAGLSEKSPPLLEDFFMVAGYIHPLILAIVAERLKLPALS